MDEQDLKHTVKTTDPKQATEFVVSDETAAGLVGTVLSERHKIISEIGSGGMGKVYKAEHLLLNKIQAVKVLHRHLTGESQNLERFKTEAKAASSLRHENLLAVTEYGVTEDKQPFIVMDYVKGESLAEVLKRQGKLSFAQFVDIFSQISKGLAHAHDQGIVHRDLKPSNIMISRTNDGALKAMILDFGIAKILPNDEGAAQHLTQTGEIFGSPLYMSPEQCRGGKIDRRSDLYSLGCVMFEALTGEVPIKGPSAVETLYRHIREEAPTISAAHPDLGIPADFQNIVAKALANDPQQRYQSAAGLAEDLGKANLDKKSPPGGSLAGGRKMAPLSSGATNKSGPTRSILLVRVMGFLLLSALTAYFIHAQMPESTPVPKAAPQQAPVPTKDAVSVPTAADVKSQLEQARMYFDEAEREVDTGTQDPQGPSAAHQAAMYALKIRQQWAPNSPTLAQSLDQVAKIVAGSPTDGSAKQREEHNRQAEDYYLKAIQMVRNDKPYLPEVGKPGYMRDLANLYTCELKFDKATSLLEDVRKTVGKSIAELHERDIGESKLLRDFANLYEMQAMIYNLPNKYIDAAKIELRLAVPNLPKEDVTVSKNPSFAGDWKMPSKPGESFALTIENAAAHKLKAHVRAETELTYSIDRDDRASGSFKGPIGEISWQACGGEANAKIIRIGHYMVWMITVRSAGGTGSPSVAILTDAQPKQ